MRCIHKAAKIDVRDAACTRDAQKTDDCGTSNKLANVGDAVVHSTFSAYGASEGHRAVACTGDVVRQGKTSTKQSGSGSGS
jgi:ribosomal protein L14